MAPGILAVILTIEKIVSYISAGLTTAKQIKESIDAGKTQIEDAKGKVLTAEDAKAAVDKAQAQVLKTGDSVKDNIEERHQNG